jgi:hypothetical protein
VALIGLELCLVYSAIPVLTSSHDGNQVISIKDEEVTDQPKGDFPVPITFPITKVEQEVSFVSVLMNKFTQTLSIIHLM